MFMSASLIFAVGNLKQWLSNLFDHHTYLRLLLNYLQILYSHLRHDIKDQNFCK